MNERDGEPPRRRASDRLRRDDDSVEDALLGANPEVGLFAAALTWILDRTLYRGRARRDVARRATDRRRRRGEDGT